MENSTVIKVIALALFIAGLSAFVFLTYAPASNSPLLWEAGAEAPVLQFYPWGGDVCVVRADNVSLVNSSGQRQWSAPVSGIEFSAMGADDRLYVYSAGHTLQCISREGRTEGLGQFAVDQPPVADSTGTVYLRYGTNLTAVAPNGTTLWNDTAAMSAPVLDGAGGIVYLASPSGQPTDVFLQCRSPDGSARWRILLQNYDDSLAVTPGDSGVYVSRNAAGELYRVLENGTVLWKYYKPYLGRYTLATDEAGLMYLIYDQGTVHVLNDQGDMISKYSLELPDASVTAGVAASNGTLYTAVRGSTPASVDLSALDLNGTCRWKTAINSTGAVRLIASGISVVAATEISRSGRTIPAIFTLDGQGNVEYAYYAADQGSWDEVCIADGIIYARTQAGMLYVLRLP